MKVKLKDVPSDSIVDYHGYYEQVLRPDGETVYTPGFGIIEDVEQEVTLLAPVADVWRTACEDLHNTTVLEATDGSITIDALRKITRRIAANPQRPGKEQQ